MASEYSIKINRRDGALEITGPDGAWVDAKLQELTSVYTDPLPADPPDNGAPASGPSKKRAKRARNPASTSAPSDGTTPSIPTKARRRDGRPSKNLELEPKLTRDVLTELQTYIQERQVAWDKKQTHQAAIIATFLHDTIAWPGVDADDLYTVYRALGLDGPTSFRSMLQNATTREKFFQGATNGKYVLSLPGENFGRRKGSA
jgi:hypothetical protein